MSNESEEDDLRGRVERNIKRGEEQLASGGPVASLDDLVAGNPVHVELPGTEATVLYDEQAHALYIKLREDITGTLETQTVIESPMVNVDLRDGEAVGIEILLAKSDESMV